MLQCCLGQHFIQLLVYHQQRVVKVGQHLLHMLHMYCYCRYCLSNAMHGQNINLPVCVSVTLSVNSPTGQTPQRIFTADSLEDTDLRKDAVPFGGLNDD